MRLHLKKYPWKLFFVIFIFLLVGFNLLFHLSLFAAQVQNDLANRYLFLSVFFFTLSLFLSALIAWRISRPVHKVTLKALSISSKKMAKEIEYYSDDEDFFRDVTGEYSELEGALNRISKKLKNRKDLIQRERNEMQAIFSTLDEGLISLSREENFLYFNSKFAAQFLDSSQMLKRPLSLTEVIRAPEVIECFREVLKTGKNKKLMTWISTSADNQQRYFSISLSPVASSGVQDLNTVIGVFHDLTEVKRAEQIRIDFVSNASHELRTPLTAIKGYVETLREDIENGRYDLAKGFIVTINRNVDRLVDLVNDLLSLSSLESHPELRLVELNPLFLTEAIINEFDKVAKEKNQRMIIRGDVGILKGDQRKLEQVLRNLIGNAMKYIPQGGEIQVIWERSDQEVILRVKDNGPGIPEEHHDRLFERFYRVDKGRSRDAGGTGLGLAIVKHIVQSHGGRVEVQSQLGQGCEFICHFPNSSR